MTMPSSQLKRAKRAIQTIRDQEKALPGLTTPDHFSPALAPRKFTRHYRRLAPSTITHGQACENRPTNSPGGFFDPTSS
jgi:hypothetical protein